VSFAWGGYTLVDTASLRERVINLVVKINLGRCLKTGLNLLALTEGED
jgi:hypothetical protein